MNVFVDTRISHRSRRDWLYIRLYQNDQVNLVDSRLRQIKKDTGAIGKMERIKYFLHSNSYIYDEERKFAP